MKGEIDHDLINISNYRDYENLCRPYLIDDVLGLAYVVAKHGNSIQKITGVSYKNSLTEAALGWSCLGRYLKENNKILYTPKNQYVRNFIKQTVHGGRVLACNKKFVSKSFTDVKVLEKFYGKDLEISVLFDKYFKHINTIKNYYKEKYESRFGDYRRVNIKNLEEYVDRKVARIPVSKELAVIDKSDLLVSSDYNSLYPSAMAHPDSKWPKIETAKAIEEEDSDRLCELFNKGDWKSLNKSGFFKVRYYNSKEIIFQHMSVKENVFNDRKNRCEEIIRFRNGDITQHVTSLDIEEVFRSGGYIVKILEGFICDNLDFNPFERFIIDMTSKRNKFKGENKTLLQTLTKKVSNSVYGGCIRKDVEESYKCVTQNWMKNEYDDSVVEWFPLKNGNNMVKIKDKEGVDDEGISKKVNSQPCQLGSFILSHSKRLRNDVILALDGFKNNKKFYTDTDSIYIHNDDYEILKTKY